MRKIAIWLRFVLAIINEQHFAVACYPVYGQMSSRELLYGGDYYLHALVLFHQLPHPDHSFNQ
jgi:hypothetical protein